jgi:hypothetical protein
VGHGVLAGVAVLVGVKLAVALGGMGLDVCVLGMMAVLVGCGVIAAGWQAARSVSIENAIPCVILSRLPAFMREGECEESFMCKDLIQAIRTGRTIDRKLVLRKERFNDSSRSLH